MVESIFLNVFCGDCILIRFKGNKGIFVNILIDGGYVKTYNTVLKPQLKKIKDRNEKIDLLVLTHYDSDHIGGILSFIRDKDFDHSIFVDRWWTNIDLSLGSPSGEISVSQLLKLKDLLMQMGKYPKMPLTNQTPLLNFYGAELTLLSPTKQGYELAINHIENEKKNISTGVRDLTAPIEYLLQVVKEDGQEDTSVSNGSSLAILLRINTSAFLLLGDASPSVVAKSLNDLGYGKDNRLKVEWMKLSHHGSKMNTSNALLDCVNCMDYILCVNGENRSGLPNKETLVRVLKNGFRKKNGRFNFYFTHSDLTLNQIFQADNPDIIDELNFETIFPIINKELIIHTKN